MDDLRVGIYAGQLIRLSEIASTSNTISSREPDLSMEDAYRISREILTRRERAGWRRIGRKIGFTNRAVQADYGVHAPIFGYMYRETVAFASGTERAYEATIPLEGLSQPLIEPEIFFSLRSQPPHTDDPAALLSAIDSYGHGYELVQCHFVDWKFAAADTVADLGLHGRYVFGPRVSIEPGSEADIAQRLTNFRVSLTRDGASSIEGGGELVLGSPLNALAHLVELLASLPDHPPLEPGELVTTGSLTTAMPVLPGQTWTTNFDGLDLPGLTLRLA